MIVLQKHLSLYRLISEFECAEREGRSFDLTYDSPEWNPHTTIFNQQEKVTQDILDVEDRELHSVQSDVASLTSSPAYTVYNRISQCSSVLLEISPTLCVNSFLGMLQSNVQIAYASTKDSTKSAAETLVQNWGINLAAAKRTVKDTTHRVLRTVANKSQSRRFRTNDRQLRYTDALMLRCLQMQLNQ